MQHLGLAIVLFIGGYLLNIFYITVFYHRGLTHNAARLSPFAMKLVATTGSWVTGLDPKAWACMHRLHHLHSDTDKDPHSPLNLGVFGVAHGQLKAYRKTLKLLMIREPKYSAITRDIPFDVNILNRKKLWILPYLLHITIALVLTLVFSSPLVGMAYFFGIMSHPIQGWAVNSLAHRFGYRNFETPDNSRNNFLVGLLVFGEGYQNNHHAFPASPNFSHRLIEPDLGYVLCKAAAFFGLLEMDPVNSDERFLVPDQMIAKRQTAAS